MPRGALAVPHVCGDSGCGAGLSFPEVYEGSSRDPSEGMQVSIPVVFVCLAMTFGTCNKINPPSSWRISASTARQLAAVGILGG